MLCECLLGSFECLSDSTMFNSYNIFIIERRMCLTCTKFEKRNLISIIFLHKNQSVPHKKHMTSPLQDKLVNAAWCENHMKQEKSRCEEGKVLSC
jgi:hypothetical protein